MTTTTTSEPLAAVTFEITRRDLGHLRRAVESAAYWANLADAEGGDADAPVRLEIVADIDPDTDGAARTAVRLSAPCPATMQGDAYIVGGWADVTPAVEVYAALPEREVVAHLFTPAEARTLAGMLLHAADHAANAEPDPDGPALVSLDLEPWECPRDADADPDDYDPDEKTVPVRDLIVGLSHTGSGHPQVGRMDAVLDVERSVREGYARETPEERAATAVPA